MHQLLLRVCATALVLGCAGELAAQSTPPLPVDSLQRGRSYARWFLAGQADSLFAVVMPGISGPLSSRATLAAAMQEAASQLGGGGAVVEERFAWRNGQRQYWHTFTAPAVPEPVVMRFVMGADGRVRGFGMSLQSQVPPADSGGPAIKP